MRENVQKPLNNTEDCRVVEIDALEKCFAEPFYGNLKSYEHRVTLCRGFRNWLLKVKEFGLPLEVWVDGDFITTAALPKYVDVACVLHYFKKSLCDDNWNSFNFFTQKRNVFIQKEYHCSVELPILNFDYIKRYTDSLFGKFQRCAYDGVFKIIL